MKVDTGIIKSNTYIGKDVYKMEIQTDLADEVQCGQFVEVEVPNYFLRRPISVCEVKEDHTIVLVYKVVGDGTRFMTTMHDEISLFGPCGNGFPVVDEDVLLIGGGVGVPPLLQTAKEYKKIGKNVSVVVGFNTNTATPCILRQWMAAKVQRELSLMQSMKTMLTVNMY